LRRSGFGLIQALFVIIIISGMLTIALKYASITTKQTSDTYMRESAELFMNSAVELSLLSIQGYDRKSHNNCLKEIHLISKDERFTADVNITKYYLYNGVDNDGQWYTKCKDRNVSIQTKESQGMVMLEVVVDTNTTNPRNRGKDIRLIRRTLQRP